jgi:chromosome segregation ATPase
MESSGDIASIVTRARWSQTRYFGQALAWLTGVAGIIGDIAAAEPAFTLERFEQDGERLEVAGHWRGLRGRRFVRPVLWLYYAEGRQRLVAVLDHKPWAAGEGDQWVAAFPWDGGKLEAERAELEVGRELVVDLPVPGGKPRKAEAKPAHPRTPTEVERLREQLAAETRERRELQAALDSRQSQADALARVRGERDAAREEAERARADGERLVNDEYRQRERALAAAEESLTRLREAEGARDLAERQLGAARASHAELEQRLADAEVRAADAEQRAGDAEQRAADARTEGADRAALKKRLADAEHRLVKLARADEAAATVAAERDALRAELAAANADRDRLRAELSLAGEHTPAPAASDPTEVDRLEAELEASRADRSRLERDLAAGWADRERLEAELVSARAGRERVEAELVSVRGERKRLERELASAPSEPAPRPLRRVHTTTPDSRLAPPREGTALWAVRLVALGLVVLLLIAVALVLGRVL